MLLTLTWVAFATVDLEAKLRQRIDYSELVRSLKTTILRQMADDAVPGVAIGLVDRQRVVWTEGFGFANLAQGRKVTPDTIFSLQSISKTYTATAFMRLVDRHLLGLDDRLVDRLPKFKIRDRFGGQLPRITMRSLLSHWAGLCQEAPVGNNYGEWHCSFKEHVESIAKTWLRSPVGSRYRYPNLGFDLAGYLMALACKRPFEDVMKAELLQPLGMRDSSFRRADATSTRRIATGYIDPAKPVPDLEIPMVAAGGLYSSVNDMTKYLRFQLANGRIGGKQWVSMNSLREMIRPQFGDAARGRGYALGVQSRPFYGGRLCIHGGGGYGFGTIQAWMPDYQIGVVVLTNGDGGGDLSESVAREALIGMIRTKLGRLPAEGPYVSDPRESVQLDPAQIRKLAGTYKATSGLATFTFEGGKLHFHRQHSDVALTPHSQTEFCDQAFTQSYRFDIGKDGNPTGVLQLGDVGQDYMAVNDLADEAKGPDIPAWSSQVGIYEATAYGQAISETVTLKNGYLYWADRLKLFPYNERLFFTADGEAVEFFNGGVLYGNRRFKRKP